MGWYKELDNERPEAIRAWPQLRIKEAEKQANSLFKPYLFFEKEKDCVKWWSSCCMKQGSQSRHPRTFGNREANILWSEHNDEAFCPVCGQTVRAKNMSRLGKRKNLAEWHPVVWLKEKQGDIYALAYWTRKLYTAEPDAAPEFMLTFAYRFTEGKAEKVYQNYDNKWKRVVLTSETPARERPIHEPFTTGYFVGEKYCSYTVFGLEEIQKSRFRYCGYEQLRLPWAAGEDHTDLMRFLGLSSLYPRQVEMLVKMGFTRIIEQYLATGKKNAGVINWKETDPRKAFGLSKTELRAFMETGNPANHQWIEIYKRQKKIGLPVSFGEIAEIEKALSYNAVDFWTLCRKHRIKPMRALRYLTKQTGPRCHGAWFGECKAFRIWKDSIEMAEFLGYDLKDETVLMPKALEAVHNERAVEQQRRLDRENQEKNEQLRLEALERLENWRAKYNFFLDGYFIRIAENAEEIIAEGKTLSHCVGGYAERHLKGAVTILFMRRADEPSKPLYTIEMQGNKLIQIHGYNNDRDREAPSKTMKWLLDEWLDWIDRGSPRTSEGAPKLRKKAKAG